MKESPSNLEVLIAAQNLGIANQNLGEESVLPEIAEQLISSNIDGLIINQKSASAAQNTQAEDSDLASNGIRIISFEERGIAQSRNRALEFAHGDYLLITDDDVSVLANMKETIIESFKAYPEADLITFQSLDENGQQRKVYSERSYWHSKRSLLKVSSIEIAIKRSSWRKDPFYIDARFGLGSLFPTGEESIFLTDLYNRGWKMRYVPKAIVQHPNASSGRALFHNENLIMAKGAMIARIFGWRAAFIAFLFALKKRKEMGYGLFQCFRLLSEGINAFKRTDDE